MGWWCNRCQTDHDVTACPRGAGSESPPTTGSALPEWLRDDASFLVCSKCGRKSYAATVINATCEMPQPSGRACDGIMQGQNVAVRRDLPAADKEA